MSWRVFAGKHVSDREAQVPYAGGRRVSKS